MKRVTAVAMVLILTLLMMGCGKVENAFWIRIGILENGDVVETGTGNDVGTYHVGMQLAILPLDEQERAMSLDGTLTDSKGILDISFDEELGMFVATVMKGGETRLTYTVSGKTYEGVTVRCDSEKIDEADPAGNTQEQTEKSFSIRLYIIDGDNVQECGFGNDMGIFHEEMTLGVIPCDNETKEPLDLSGELYTDDGQIDFQYDDDLGMFVGMIEKSESAELFYEVAGICYSGTRIEVE